MRHFLFVIFISVFTVGYSQNKWDTSIELDFVFPNQKKYFYNDSDNRIFDTELNDYGFLLSSFGLQGNYNYFLFKKLSLGILGGFQTETKQNFTMIKLGGILRYYFVDRDNVYVYLQDANNFSLNTDRFQNGNNLRLGLGLPIMKRESYSLTSNLFFEQNYFRLDNAEPLLGFADERPRSLTVQSIGVSLGVKF